MLWRDWVGCIVVKKGVTGQCKKTTKKTKTRLVKIVGAMLDKIECVAKEQMEDGRDCVIDCALLNQGRQGVPEDAIDSIFT